MTRWLLILAPISGEHVSESWLRAQAIRDERREVELPIRWPLASEPPNVQPIATAAERFPSIPGRWAR